MPTPYHFTPEVTKEIAELPPAFTPVTRKSVTPHYLLQETPPELETTVAPSTFEKFDPSAVIAEGKIPEIKPAFLGLRSIITKKRLGRVEKQIMAESPESTDDSKHIRVARFVGKQILEGGSYTTRDTELRPTSFKERRTAKKLDKYDMAQRKRQRYANNIADPYIVTKKDPETDKTHIVTEKDPKTGKTHAKLNFKRGNVSAGERYADMRNGLVHRRLSNKAARQRAKFDRTAHLPGHVEKLVERRKELTLKAKALEDAKLAKETKKKRKG
jgi:hypothetical protein